MENREFIDRGDIDSIFLKSKANDETIGIYERICDAKSITEQEIAKPLFDEFKKKLSKWMYYNSESVCGDSMIDIYYLEGHIDEILYEMGVIGEVEDGSN